MSMCIKSGILCSVFCFTLLFCSCCSADKEKTAGSLTIVANVVVVNPDYKSELLKAFETVVEATRKEPGNISYELFEDTANPLRFTFVETWKSQEAINSHNNSTHFQQFAKTVEGKADLEVYILKPKY